MFISTLDLFKIGIGPSSSHTLGPMVAAYEFRNSLTTLKADPHSRIRCTLKGSLAYTGRGHASDRAVILGLHGYRAADLTDCAIDELISRLQQLEHIESPTGDKIAFKPSEDIIFDLGDALPEHPNGMIFELWSQQQQCLASQTYFSIGGGFINTREQIHELQAPLQLAQASQNPYPFANAKAMLTMARESQLSIAQMKRHNELQHHSENELQNGLNGIWQCMEQCVERGLQAEGQLPGGLGIKRRARNLHKDLHSNPHDATLNDWLCAYAMAVNEENAAGHMVVTAPTNGAAGVIPAVLYYFVHQQHASMEQVQDFLLTAAAIGGLIKHNSSISGAEVGCQGEVGSASAMAAAGLCAARGGTPAQVENAAEIALEHHLGMTCDPVNGLVQVPCIERNGFGAIKAYTAASLALRGDGSHFMPLDSCIAAMKQTGLEMSNKFKETALGGLAVSLTEC